MQVVRPRVALPLGGLLPPKLFGVDEFLGFDSTSDGAEVRSVDPHRIELRAKDWDLLLVTDSDGQITVETQIVFNLIFDQRHYKVRCRPVEPVVGSLKTFKLGESNELAGNFDIEIAHCEDVETGKRIRWPSQPLILHGSFDRLPIKSGPADD